MDLKETNKVMPNPAMIVRLAMIERQDQEQKKNDRYTVSSEDMNI